MANWTKIGEVAVDSGLLMVGDPCYAETIDYDREILAGTEKEFSVGLQLEGERGVVFSTPYGDGVYAVYGLFAGSCLIAFKIDLVDDEEELDHWENEGGGLEG